MYLSHEAAHVSAYHASKPLDTLHGNYMSVDHTYLPYFKSQDK